MSNAATNLVLILTASSGILMLLETVRAARGMPQGSTEIDFNGPSCYGIAEINGIKYNVKYLVNGSFLFVISIWPRFVLTLDMSELHLEKKRAFIGTRVRVTPSDRGEWRVLKEMVITHFSARRIEKMSNGEFGYSRIR